MAIHEASDFRPDEENVAYVGAGVTLKGEISAPDAIVVDGTIEGDVSTRLLLLGQGGVIRGRVSVTEADVSGWISDQIEVKQSLVVRATGRIEGKVSYGDIELEKGAVITGDLTQVEDHRAAAKPAAAKFAAGRAAAAREERPERAERIERVEAAPPPAPQLPKPSNASIERINEAVRNARGGGAKGALYVAAEGEGRRVGGRLLLGRKESA
ncbi:polymer-forming cytoskeletal protein [Methylocystis sp. 9N]|uniref:Polymer-forming cytoskeletal protein n=1 Tax=Methylocystis borbori TaxID=3118750 RepID=A0ABU7XJH7_9HYPH